MTTSSEIALPADETIREAARQVRTIRRYRGRASGTFAIGVLIPLLVAIVEFGHYVPPGPLCEYGLLLLILPCLPVVVAGLMDTGLCYRAQRRLRRLFRTDDSDVRQQFSPSVIGSVLDILASPIVAEFLFPLLNLLDDLLKSLPAQETAFLTKVQRDVLHELVRPGHYETIQVTSVAKLREPERRKLRPAVIRALGCLGNDSSIPLLEQFASNTDSPALQQAALFSVGQINERHRYGSEQLLRAGSAPDRPDTLLRAVPTGESRNHDPQQLLRTDNSDPHLKNAPMSESS